MPGTVEGAADMSASKRKRLGDGEPRKKRRISVTLDVDAKKGEFLEMEKAIVTSKKNYNDMCTLIDAMAMAKGTQQDDIRTAALAAESLCRVFIHLLGSGAMAKKQGASEKDVTITAWLREQLGAYKKYLWSLFAHSETALQAMAFAMTVLKAEGLHLSAKDDYAFPRQSLDDIVNAVFLSTKEELLDHFIGHFVEQYVDIRFYAFQTIKYVGPPSLFPAGRD
jgi:U3 small nucleolar RNA-associated protein 19